MDDSADPLLQFFTEAEVDADDNLLYTTLSLSSAEATPEEIRKAYRRAALRLHPDKHAGKGGEEVKKMGRDFQRVGFAYAVLSDEGRRKRYDETGRTDENQFADAEAMGWDAYFESLFQRVDRRMLDEHKEKYQGSQEELDDLAKAYNDTSGSLPEILTHIPHSQHADEPRLIAAVNTLIASGTLSATKKWTSSSVDNKARDRRRKAAEKEGKEAEETAKELGVWEEYYGSGAKGKRKGKGKGKENENGKAEGSAGGDGEDALRGLILKRQREREGGLDRLEEKYRRMEEEKRAKKAGAAGAGGKKKKARKSGEEDGPPPEISDADFEALQAKMFGTNGQKGGKREKSSGESGMPDISDEDFAALQAKMMSGKKGSRGKA